MGRFLKWACAALSCMAGVVFAEAPVIRILPLGDSITHGAANNDVNPPFTGGYRKPLYNLLTQAGYNVEFVGTRTQNSGDMVSPVHEGYPGYRISNWWNTGAGGIYEVVWDSLSKVKNPHVILLHIGTNDSGDHPYAEFPAERLELLLDRLAAFEPGAEIVLSSLTRRTEEANQKWIHETFNPALPGIVAAHRAKGQKVRFLDLEECLGSDGLSDTCHPNEVGYQRMAAKWFEAVTGIVTAPGWQPDDTLSVMYAVTNDSPASLSFKLNGEMDAASVADVSHYTVDGAAVKSAALGSDKHTVTVTFTSPVTCDEPHTLVVSGLANAAGTTTLATTTVPFEVAGRGAAAHVSEADLQGFRKVLAFDFPAHCNLNNGTDAVYSEDRRATVSAFSRVAYFFEIREKGGRLKWLWTAMDAFTDDPMKLGVPTQKSGVLFDCYVSNLVIRTNVEGLPSGTRERGNIEFWPWNYTAGVGSFTVPGGDGQTYDFDDTPNPGSGNFGSMQIHDFENQTVLFSWTRWGGIIGNNARGDANYTTIGFGNAPDGCPDWTNVADGKHPMLGCARNNDIMHMEVYVIDSKPERAPVTTVGVQSGFRARTEIDVAAGATRTETGVVHQEGASRIFKTGDGTWKLPVTAFRQRQPFDLGVRGGRLELTKGDLLPGAEKPTATLAKAALWLSATTDDGALSPKVVVTNGANGVRYVAKWCDERETNVNAPTGIYAFPAWSDPAYTTLTGIPPTYETISGVPGVYFAGYTSGKCMVLKRGNAAHEISVIRDVFYVHGAYATMGYVLANALVGSGHGFKNSYITAPSAAFKGTSNIWASQLETGPARTGFTFLDGAFVENPYDTKHPVGTHLISVKSERTDGYLSGFYNNQCYQNRQGGDYLNEVVVFTNELTVAERTAVTRYLMHKWRIEPNPGTTGGCVEVADGATVSVEIEDATFPPVTVTGAGIFEKSGAAAAPFKQDGFRGTVRLSAGALTGPSFEDVGFSLQSGKSLVHTTTTAGDTLSVGTADAGVAGIAGGSVRATRVEEDVEQVRVSSGALVLSAPLAPAFGALPPGFDPVVTNGTFEKNSGNAWTKFPDDAEFYGWWRHGGEGGNIWQLHEKNYQFGKLPYMAADSDWYLNIQGNGSFHYTRVRIDRPGVYELSFDCSARENFDRYLCTVRVGPSLDTLTDLGVFKTQRAGAFIRAAFRTTFATPGSYLVGVRARTTGSMGSIAGGALFDNFRVAFLAEEADPDVWRVPNGDFELLTAVHSGNGIDSKVTTANTAMGWTFENPETTADENPYVGVVVHGMIHTDKHSYYAPRADALGMTELFFFDTKGTARTTFRPPAGTWTLRADLASCPAYFRSKESFRWNHTQGKLAASVTAGGTTTALGTAARDTHVMGPVAWPTAFTVDGSTDVTLELRNGGEQYDSCLVDNLELVRVDGMAKEYVRDGDFEIVRQSAWNATPVSDCWRIAQNKLGQTYSYLYFAPYTYLPKNIGTSAYSGSQYAIVCGSAYMEQDLDFDAAGMYAFTMQTASRYDSTLAAGTEMTRFGLNPLKAYICPVGGDFTRDAIEIGDFPCVTAVFMSRTAYFHVPAAGRWTLRIMGQATEANCDRISRVDGVSVKKARFAADVPDVPETAQISIAAGAKLRLEYPGTIRLDRLELGGRSVSGTVTAKSHPAYVSGPGAVEVRAKSTVLIFR